jgi:NAD(P)-dependent dehydrogenase (short-subunit alcohol dehydrogenase family)
MQIKDKVVVVTGGANGIGRALCHKFQAEGARMVMVADVDEDHGSELLQELKQDHSGFCHCDVTDEEQVRFLVDTVTEAAGQIDIFCSNAGIAVDGGVQAKNEGWQRSWEVNVMAHVYAARAVLPQMLARGEGYLLQTVSAAGLLTQIGSAPYSVTKHGAMAFAEWLAVTYYDQGIHVSALCPQGVRTDMLANAEAAGLAFLTEGALEPEQVADEAIRAIGEERFLVLPHPDVEKYFQNKANDYERWLRGMRKLHARAFPRNTQ